MNRDGLADFLRRQRKALQPGDVGLSAGARRRARGGLRREEVAGLARMSTDFYARLEQRRGARPSEQTIAALAGHIAPPRTLRTDHTSPRLLRVLDQLDTPAQIVSDLGVTPRQNPPAEAQLGAQTRCTGMRRSVIYRWYTDPVGRRIHPADDHPLHSRSDVASLRAVPGRAGDDPEARELVTHLLLESDEFAALWQRHEVASRAGTLQRFIHPLVGPLTLDCQILTAENFTERLVVFTAIPGSEDARRIALLTAMIGSRGFSSGVAPDAA